MYLATKDRITVKLIDRNVACGFEYNICPGQCNYTIDFIIFGNVQFVLLPFRVLSFEMT
jgi:hypothetical protein